MVLQLSPELNSLPQIEPPTVSDDVLLPLPWASPLVPSAIDQSLLLQFVQDRIQCAVLEAEVAPALILDLQRDLVAVRGRFLNG